MQKPWYVPRRVEDADEGESVTMTWKRGTLAAVAAIGIFGAVGVAGASNVTDHEIHAPQDIRWEPSGDLTVQTGDKVTWTFEENSFHNVESTSSNWSMTNGPPGTTTPVSYEFRKSGTYTFTCRVHVGAMDGTITVQGADLPDPEPTVTATPTPTPTPTPSVQPSPPDTTAPTVSSVKVRTLRRGARVRFALSEPATVTLKLLRGTRVLKTVRVQARGVKTVTVRSAKLRKGRRYRVQLLARDARGNTSSPLQRRLSIRR
jgi:plastocyanin